MQQPKVGGRYYIEVEVRALGSFSEVAEVWIEHGANSTLVKQKSLISIPEPKEEKVQGYEYKWAPYEKLNNLGADGWRVIHYSVDAMQHLMERPL